MKPKISSIVGNLVESKVKKYLLWEQVRWITENKKQKQ